MPYRDRVIESEATIFEAAILPHRSLGPRGVRLVASFLIAVSTLTTTITWLAGAWPVAGFAGAEIALAVWLLARNAAGDRSGELLRLTERALYVIRRDRRGRDLREDWPRAWLRIELQERPGRTPGLYLVARDRRGEIGRALGEAEKRDLASAIRNALTSWPEPTAEA